MIELANARWFPIFNTFFTGTTAALWYLSSGRIGWPLLVIILVPWYLRVLAGHFPVQRTPFDGWLLLFGITAVFSSFTAYSQANAESKLWVLIGALALYFAIVSVSRSDLWLLAGSTGPVGALLAIYFVLSNDWQAWPAEIGVFNRLGARWMAIRPSFGLPVLHPNTLAGMMALLMPFIVAFGLFCWCNRRRRWLRFAGVTGVITAGGLFLTSSLGAWLALAAGFSIWGLWILSGRLQRKLQLSQTRIFVLVVVLLLILGLFLIVAVTISGVNHAQSRLFLARQTLYLIQDFAITGSGLATFPALYAQYIRVTPVFFVAYSNLFLDIWLEQGIVALVALLVLLGGSFWLLLSQLDVKGKTREAAVPRWRSDRMNSDDMVVFRWGAFVSLSVMVLHGLLDDALYGSFATPLLFFTPAFVVLVTRHSETETAVSFTRGFVRFSLSLGVVAVIWAGLFFGFRRQIEAQWYANLGALALARAELVGWPTGQWDAGQDLDRFAEASALLEQSLTLNPDNRTAHHRLGLIAMVARDYETAVAHLQRANAQAANHRGIRKSLGYSYVWLGQYEPAVEYLAKLPETRREITYYAGWWQRQNQPNLAAQAHEMAVILEEWITLNP